MSLHPLDSHLNFRMSSRDKKTIETAAKIKGLKPNTYARQKLLEAAEKDIMDMSKLNALLLNTSDWNQFLEVMEAPIGINQKLKDAVKDYRKAFSK